MNNLPLEISTSTAEESRSLIIAKYPVRLLHYVELGVILGCLLVLGIHSIEKKSPRWDRIVREERVPDPMPITPSNPGDGENPDRDGDGIPNEWETTHSHNPDFAADAASDFDNDGLTTLQEYQLWLRTSGQAGKPLGKWQAKEIPIGQLPFDTSKFVNFYQYGGVTAANDRGDILLGFQLEGETTNGAWEESQHAAFLMIDGSMKEIQIPGKTSGFTHASDINEQGEVLLQWYSEDGTGQESYFLKSDNSVTQITLDGNPCFAYRINNFGDWVGYKITENQGWQPAHVVDGMPMPMHQSLTTFGFSDINDYGQIIGYYFDWVENRPITFTQFGSQFFSTGQNGGLPRFDETTYQWEWPGAINNWGEFTGGVRDYSWNESAFFFDGSYKLIVGLDSSSRSWPVGLSKNGMVLFGVDSGDYGIAKPYLWRDSVTVDSDALFSEAPWNSDGGYIDANKITSEGKILYMRYDAYNLPASVLTLTPDQDSDGDGMPDDWEEFYGFNPNLNDANLDSDGDGTNNLGEFLLRSDPHAVPDYNPENELIDTRPGVDTDGDGIPNNWEVVNGMNYEDPSDAALDFDRDGYTNLQELRLNTDPRGAPAYRIRQIGPFSGVSGVDISKVTLSEGSISGNPDNAGGDQMAEEVFFTASITPYTSLPVMWSQPRTEDNGVLSFYPSATEESRKLVAHSPSGAVLTSNHYYPKVFTYWSKHNADSVTFTAIENDIYITDLYNVTFSPSGKYLFAIRQNSLGIYEPIAWKMPSSDNILYQPVVITAPEGATIETWLTAYINDYGIITANGSVEGQTRGIVWTMNEYGNSLEGAILPNLSGDNYANVIGLSNHSAPIVAGNALNAEYQERATVWKYISPTSFSPMDLGALPNGNASQIVKISPNGTLAGVANTLHEDELKQHIICAIPVIPSSSDSIDPTLYRLTPQGEPYSNGAIISHVTNTGEIIANIYSSANDPELFLLSKGKSHSLASSIPKSSGYELREIIGANAQGSLLVTALKDSALETMILTPDRDTDGDGLPDAWENPHQFNPFSKNSRNADTDNDGLTDLLEYANNTHPRIPDTDGDGMKDGWEVEWGFLPLDPHDAQLDPDEDRVTNLRESQIGTVPTGVYKVETRHIDTDWQFPQILAAGDDGTIVRSGGYTYHVIDDNYEYGYDYSQNVFALPPVASNVTFQLPDNRHSFYYNGDWTQFLYSNSRANYFSDSASGKIHADRYRQLHQSGPNGGENIYEEAYFLTPDITNFPNESDWISLETVENNLRNPDLHNSFPPLSDSESLNRNAACVSPSGIRRLYRSSDWSKQLLLNQRGEFVEHLSNDLNWQVINDQGLAAGIVINEGPETPYSGCSHLPWLFLSDGQSLLLPHDPSSSIFPDWALLSYSNDGKILLRNFYQNVQSIWTYRFFLYDSTTGRLDRIRLPASAYSSVSSLSNQNGRMLIQGSKPSQITPDGTCIRLDALRVTDEIHGTPVPLRELYPNTITPSHISSDGRITFTTTNSNGNNVIIQITNHNDANNDGLPDDWTQAQNVTDPDADDDGDGLSNRREYELGTDPKNLDTDGDGISDSIEIELGTDPINFDSDKNGVADGKEDSDADGLQNSEDADPADSIVNWQKTGRPSFAVIEIPIEKPNEVHYVDHSTKGTILLRRTPVNQQSSAVIIDKEQKVHEKDFIWVTHLHDDLVPLRQSTDTSDDSFYDPLTDTYLPWNCPTNYQDSIADVRDGLVIGKYWLVQTGMDERLSRGPGGQILPGQEQNISAHWASIDRESNIASVSHYWKKEANGSYNVQNYSTAHLSEARAQSAIHRQTIAGVEKKWTLVARPGTPGIQISQDGTAFAAATKRYGAKRFNAVTRQGWIIGEDNRVWTGEKWETLLDILGEDFTEAELLGINDDGMAVAKIKKGSGPMKVGLLMPAEMIPDYNRDCKINQIDIGRVTQVNPYRFWINDDNDFVGEYRSSNSIDIPGSDENESNAVIDGIRDLVDFFPLHFDLVTVLKTLPHTQYKYLLKHPEGAVKFYEAADTPLDELHEAYETSGPSAYLKDEEMAKLLDGATVKHAKAVGVELGSSVLDAFAIGQGVLLCEITKETASPLILEIQKDSGTLLAKIEFPMNTSGVENMYRHVNLRTAAGGLGGRATDIGIPSNYPDDLPGLNSDKYFVFLHGYNVNGEQARAWHSEAFKRLWWSGSKARFIGVSWHGEESQGGAGMTSPVAPVIPDHITPNFHANVINAFQTADELAAVVNGLSGKVNIAAHSLGNMVVSLAIQDHGMNPENYFLFDAAVAIEAFEAGAEFQPNMVNGHWKDYDDRLWASEWHKLTWPENDPHRKLTWRGRLGDVVSRTNVYNFYSSEEEVLSNATVTLSSTFIGAVADDLILDYITEGNVLGENVWALQEILKGKGITGEVLGSKYGGWKFNYKFLQWSQNQAPPTEISQYYAGLMENLLNPLYPQYYTRLLRPDEVTGLAGQDRQLRQKPFFDPPPNEFDHAELLARCFPARTNPAGSNPVDVLDDQGEETYNFNMVSLKMGWFSTDIREKRWLHSDLKDVAYLYTHKVWYECINIGKLNE